MDNKVMIFIRPQESPVVTDDDQNIRISYGNLWVSFRDGKVLVEELWKSSKYKDLYIDGYRGGKND